MIQICDGAVQMRPQLMKRGDGDGMGLGSCAE